MKFRWLLSGAVIVSLTVLPVISSCCPAQDVPGAEQPPLAQLERRARLNADRQQNDFWNVLVNYARRDLQEPGGESFWKCIAHPDATVYLNPEAPLRVTLETSVTEQSRVRLAVPYQLALIASGEEVFLFGFPVQRTQVPGLYQAHMQSLQSQALENPAVSELTRKMVQVGVQRWACLLLPLKAAPITGPDTVAFQHGDQQLKVKIPSVAELERQIGSLLPPATRNRVRYLPPPRPVTTPAPPSRPVKKQLAAAEQNCLAQLRRKSLLAPNAEATGWKVLELLARADLEEGQSRFWLQFVTRAFQVTPLEQEIRLAVETSPSGQSLRSSYSFLAFVSPEESWLLGFPRGGQSEMLRLFSLRVQHAQLTAPEAEVTALHLRGPYRSLAMLTPLQVLAGEVTELLPLPDFNQLQQRVGWESPATAATRSALPPKSGQKLVEPWILALPVEEPDDVPPRLPMPGSGSRTTATDPLPTTPAPRTPGVEKSIYLAVDYSVYVAEREEWLLRELQHLTRSLPAGSSLADEAIHLCSREETVAWKIQDIQDARWPEKRPAGHRNQAYQTLAAIARRTANPPQQTIVIVWNTVAFDEGEQQLAQALTGRQTQPSAAFQIYQVYGAKLNPLEQLIKAVNYNLYDYRPEGPPTLKIPSP